MFAASEVRAKRSDWAALFAAGAERAVADQPSSISRTAVPGVEFNIPLPVIAAAKAMTRYIRASRRLTRHGLFFRGIGLSIDHPMNAIQIRSPGMPSSRRIRAYSFSKVT